MLGWEGDVLGKTRKRQGIYQGVMEPRAHVGRGHQDKNEVPVRRILSERCIG